MKKDRVVCEWVAFIILNSVLNPKKILNCCPKCCPKFFFRTGGGVPVLNFCSCPKLCPKFLFSNLKLLRANLNLWIDFMLLAVGGFCVTMTIWYYYLGNRANLTRTRWYTTNHRGLECRRWFLLEINNIFFTFKIRLKQYLKLIVFLNSNGWCKCSQWAWKPLSKITVIILSISCIPDTLLSLFSFFILKYI